MDHASKNIGNDARPVIYAGRFADEATGAGLSEDYRVLSDWDTLPYQLAAGLRQARVIVILDIFSFPFEAVAEIQHDISLIVALPEGFDAGFLEEVFGEPLFRHLGFFDRVAVRDDLTWETLSHIYRWTENQRIIIGDDGPAAAVAEILDSLEAAFALPSSFGDGAYETYRYWNERGDALARLAPQRAVCSARPGLSLTKAMHRVQAAALAGQFDAARDNRAEDVPFDVLEVGSGVGRWTRSFDPATTRFNGVDISEGMVAAARASFPWARFDKLGRDLRLPYEDESLDLVFSVDVLHHNDTSAKHTLLSEMWRVTRPGGRLLFLEDFVAGQRLAQSTVYPMSVTKFAGLVIEASAGRVTLEYVESLRYPRDDVVRGGLLVLSKLGVPQRW